MAPATNWLSFSLSPAEMLRSSAESQLIPYETSSTASPHYLLDNFYANGWANTKQIEASSDSPILTSFVDHHIQSHGVPKLEDFLGDSSQMIRYSESQTETQDSSLTQIYDHGSTYFINHQDLKAVPGFQAFSANSGSEVDDSAHIARNQLARGEFIGHSMDSSGTELAFANCSTGALSLGFPRSSEKAVVSAQSDSSKKISDTYGQRTSIYRGVTRHRWTGRYEAHLWDNSCRREGQARKGRQVYLGGYDKEDKAARAYDLAAMKYWGPTATTNFPVSNYTKDLEEMKLATKQEFIASLRRKSSGFSRGASIYRGVTRHHQQGRWQARIGRVAGNKDLYLGTFATEEEAAEAYDIAAIKFRGLNAVTNFEMGRYDVEAILKSNLPIGGAAKRLKLSLESEQKPSMLYHNLQPPGNNISFAPIQPCPAIPYNASTPMLYHHNLLNHLQTNGLSTSSATPNPQMAAPMNSMILPPPGEFFGWPHHSY